MKTRNTLCLLISLSLILLSGMARAGDLDDGISKYDDEGIAKDDEIGKADQNIKFIVLNAKSKAATKKGDKDKMGTTGGANMNSVVLGAGSKVKGDIYIIDQSKGPKTNISD